ncbi:MAG: tRNA pseudouridine(38-40) synthase TruA [Rikenellaceae bacterium]
MSRYFLELSYDGTSYNGWQIQPNAPSIQQTIETSLSKLLATESKIVGCGRTDTGVNASYYIAQFDTERIDKVEKEGFLYHLNCILPSDIAIHSIKEVSDDMHARFSATEREYQYYISTRKSPFNRHVYQYYIPLDIEKMNKAAKLLLTYDDFTSFAKLHSDNSSNICDVMVAQWTQQGDKITFTIRANRFLRNMVRSITGTLLDVGKGKISVDDFAKIIEAKDNSRAASSAPARGLFLTDVVY